MIIQQLNRWPQTAIPNTFLELDRIRQELSRMLEGQPGRERTGLSAGVFPLMNVSQDQENFYIRSEIPGVSLDDIDITINGRGVTVSGERKIPVEDQEARYHRREREGGTFRRQFNLPMDIDTERVQATYRHGVLTIVLPKATSAKPKKISIAG